MVRGIALLLTVLTGFSGLVYEVTWQKSFAILLGSDAEATAAVLGIFLGGLSLGYSLFGWVSRRMVERARAHARPPRLLAVYGAIEAGIGAWALLFPALFEAARALSVQLPDVPDAFAFGVDVFLTVLLIGPPTVLMGATIPVLTQALAHSLRDATRFHALVYGFNTAGAFVGALAAGFLLVPWLGIPATLWAMGAVNLTAGLSFALLGLRPRTVAVPPAQAEAPRLAGFPALATAALLLGFAMMSVQTVLIRLGGLSFGASQYTFAMVVAVFVFSIALGSLVVSAFEHIPRALVVACPLGLAGYLVLLYPVLPDAPYGAHLLRTLFRDTDAAFYPYWAAVFLGILTVLVIPVGLSGASLPLLFHTLRRDMRELGSVAGRLYSWNTVGSLLGALLGGYLLLFWLDLTHVYRIAVGAVAVAGALMAVRLVALPSLPAVVASGLTLAALTQLPAWSPTLLCAGLFRVRQPTPQSYAGVDAIRRSLPLKAIPFHDDDPTTTVTVMDHLGRDGRVSRAIVTNGKPDGSLVFDYPTMALAGLLPCLMADSCEKAFVIGWGTGVTAGELGALDSIRRVDVAEISSGVLRAAPLFDNGNQGASRNPKIHAFRNDAYRALLRSDRRYDVIVSEPSNPWVSGVELLYSREFLEAGRDHLEPGGVYVQWYHTYESDSATVALVMRTYTSVFDQVAVWFTVGPDLLLLGVRNPETATLDRVQARMERPDVLAGLHRAGIDSLPQLLAHELLPLGVVNAAQLGGDVQTLLHPVLSHRAARAFFAGQEATLPPTASVEAIAASADHSLLQAYAEQQGGHLRPWDRRQVVEEVCRTRRVECAALLARWFHDDPDSPDFRQVLSEVRRNPLVSAAGQLNLLRQLAPLYDGAAESVTTTPQSAQHSTQLFGRYYTYAAPFPRSTLEDIWRRCQAPGCRQARLEVESLVGSVFHTGGT